MAVAGESWMILGVQEGSGPAFGSALAVCAGAQSLGDAAIDYIRGSSWRQDAGWGLWAARQLVSALATHWSGPGHYQLPRTGCTPPRSGALLEEASTTNPKAPRLEGSYYFPGLGRRGAAITPAFTQHVAQSLQADAAIQEERRKAREEQALGKQ